MNIKELSENLGLDEDEYLELVELFITTGTGDFLKIQSALSANDADTIMRSAHTIKGAAGNLGLVEVSETARRIEEIANSDQLENMGEAVQILKNQIDAIETQVNR